jgi:capsular polysaccharide export protein
MLQGPNGPFFSRVARRLRLSGSEIHKVNFNAGDDLYFSGPNVRRFTEAEAKWPDYLSSLIRELKPEGIVLFGDCRPLHRVAIALAEAEGVEVYVFEEGYVRPDYVTLEYGGVNGHSRMPTDPEFYRAWPVVKAPEPEPIRYAFSSAVFHTCCYALWTTLFSSRYPEYRHHRDLRVAQQAGAWFRGTIRRVFNGVRDRALNRRLQSGTMPPYFFVPLQVHLDSQLQHSGYQDITEFIGEVVLSFAQHAPADATLLLKHHPFDRAYRDYTELLAGLREKYALGERLVYADVISIPHTLRGALGTVTINSTVGLSSVHHGTPVICLGRAIYNIQGLTYAGSLDDFWRSPGAVDGALYAKFVSWLKANVLINGCVWQDLNVTLPPAEAVAGRAPVGQLSGE